MLQYSASAEERETVLCFFLCQLIRAGPKVMQNPVREHLLSEHDAQPTSQKADGCKELLLGKQIPLEGQPFR